MTHKIVLSDALFICYENFNRIDHLNNTEKKRAKRLLSCYRAPHLTNIAQLNRCKSQLPDVVYDRLAPALAQASHRNQALEDLARKTLYQLILTEDETHRQLPYFNIKQKNVESNYTITCAKGNDRKDLQNHIERLCASAKKILICDQYFIENWRNTFALFNRILPRHTMKIEYVETNTHAQFSDKISAIKKICRDWILEEYHGSQYENLHDRYLVIDHLQIILTSGFDYLWNTNKEITCVFRELNP